MLAAQMVPIHNALMNYARHVEPGGGWVDEASAARIVTKLAHTFVSQVEAFLRLRVAEEKTGQPVFTITAGGQAIVGKGMQAPGQMAPDRKAGASAPAASAGTNVVRMPEK